MKRQLGAVLVVLVLFCAPAMWAQSDSDSSSSSSSSSSSASSPSSSPSDSSSTGASCRRLARPVRRARQRRVAVIREAIPIPSSKWALETASGSTGSSDDSSQSTQGPQSTFTHPEQLPPLQMINDVTHNTGVGFSLNAGSLTDYVWGSHGQGYWQNMALWAGGVNFSQLRSTSIVQLGYIGGVNLTNITIPGATTSTQLYPAGERKNPVELCQSLAVERQRQLHLHG